MTDAIYPQDVRVSASEIEDRAADWLMERKDERNWTEEDQKALDAWLAQSLAHQVAFFRLEAALDRAERLRALQPSVRQSNGVWSIALKAVATLSLVAIAGVVGARYMLGPRVAAYQTSIGDSETLSLGDGSQIELNTDTSLRVAQGSNGRQAWLDRGEAYFQIKHDAQHPFTVIAGDSRVTDLGTKFTLRRFPDRVEVTLIEGGARLDADKDQSTARSVTLRPGDMATVSNGAIKVARKSEQTLADELGWRHGILTFRYMTLAQAADELNRYNRTQIVITDPHVAKLTIYGAFTANDAAAFADAVQTDFKLHVENLRDRIVLAR
jgi:transmembrane sensor